MESLYNSTDTSFIKCSDKVLNDQHNGSTFSELLTSTNIATTNSDSFFSTNSNYNKSDTYLKFSFQTSDSSFQSDKLNTASNSDKNTSFINLPSSQNLDEASDSHLLILKTQNDLTNCIRLSLELSPLTQQKIWRILWKYNENWKFRKFEDFSGNALMQALKFIQNVLLNASQDGLPVDNYIPFREWSLNELDILERNYILNSEICHNSSIHSIVPSIKLSSPISLTPTNNLIQAIKNEINTNLKHNCTVSDITSSSSCSESEGLKDILVESEGEIDLQNKVTVSDDEASQKRLESNLKCFFTTSSTASTSVSTYSEDKKNHSFISQKRSRNQTYDTTTNSLLSSTLSMPYLSKKIPKQSTETTFECPKSKTILPIEATDALHNENLKNCSHTTSSTNSNFISLAPPNAFDSKSNTINTDQQELRMLTVLEELQKELLSEHTHLHHESFLSVDIQLDKYIDLLQEIPMKFQESLSKMRWLDTDLQFLLKEKYLPLQKKLSKLCEEKKKLEGSISSPILPNHDSIKAEPSLDSCSNKIDTTPSSTQFLKKQNLDTNFENSSINITKIDLENSHSVKNQTQLQSNEHVNNSIKTYLELENKNKNAEDMSEVVNVSINSFDTHSSIVSYNEITKLNSKNIDTKKAKNSNNESFYPVGSNESFNIESNNYVSNTFDNPNFSQSNSKEFLNKNKNLKKDCLQLNISNHKAYSDFDCNQNIIDNTNTILNSSSSSIPSNIYWKEEELQKLQLCERLYEQVEHASLLKIALCDNLHTMLEDRLQILDNQFKNNTVFHDLFYGKDVLKPDSLPIHLIRNLPYPNPQNANFQQNKFDTFFSNQQKK